MKYDGRLLPESFLKCLSAEDRKSLGKGGQTPHETLLKAKIKSERQLQGVIVNYLRLHGIEVLWHRTDKKSHATEGWPDITFAVVGHDGYSPRVWACAIEVKLPGETLRENQRAMRRKMTASPNNWTCRTITSVAEMKMFLEGIGVE